MPLETRLYSNYTMDKKKSLIQCVIAGLAVGLVSKMCFDSGRAMGSVMLPAIITGNNRQKDLRSYATNYLAYSLSYFAGYASYSALEILLK